jgi:hypothetical protein
MLRPSGIKQKIFRYNQRDSHIFFWGERRVYGSLNAKPYMVYHLRLSTGPFFEKSLFFLFLFIYLFLVVLGFELKASHLLGVLYQLIELFSVLGIFKLGSHKLFHPRP